MKPLDLVGLVGPAVAVVLWMLSRWTHAVLRCLRGASAGAFELNACAAIAERPIGVFDLWLLATVVSAGSGVVLIVKGRRLSGALAIGGSLGVFVLAASLM